MGNESELREELKKVRSELKNIRKQLETARRVHQKDISHVCGLLQSDKKRENSDPVERTLAEATQLDTGGPTPCIQHQFTPIGHIESVFREKNGTPRQASVCQTSQAILRLRPDLYNNPEHSLDGLTQYSHIWVLYVFHKNNNVYNKAKVAPPRLNGVRVGVFSTRSPYRACPIGLSLVKITHVAGSCVYMSGVDMLDGTPILDIKPYIPQYDNPLYHALPGDLLHTTGSLAEGPSSGMSDNMVHDVHTASHISSGSDTPSAVGRSSKLKLDPDIGLDPEHYGSVSVEDCSVLHRHDPDKYDPGSNTPGSNTTGSNNPGSNDPGLNAQEPNAPGSNDSGSKHPNKFSKIDTNKPMECQTSNEKLAPHAVGDATVASADWVKTPPIQSLKVTFTCRAEEQLHLMTAQPISTTDVSSTQPISTTDVSSTRSISTSDVSSTRPISTTEVSTTRPISATDVFNQSDSAKNDFQEPVSSSKLVCTLTGPTRKIIGTAATKQAIVSILSADPRSTYRRRKCEDKLYYFTVDGLHVTCWFDGDTAEVLKIKYAS